jgi:hypothetical protein
MQIEFKRKEVVAEGYFACIVEKKRRACKPRRVGKRKRANK